MRSWSRIHGSIIAAGLALLAVLLFTLPPLETLVHDGILRRFALLERADSELMRNALTSSTDLSGNFDRLVFDLRRIDRLRTEIRDSIYETFPEQRDAMAPLFRELDALYSAKKRLLQTFKRRHAVLRNSIRYLPRLSANLRRGSPEWRLDESQLAVVHRVLETMMSYQISPDPSTKKDLEQMLDRIGAIADGLPGEERKPLDLLASHMRILLENRMKARTDLLDLEAIRSEEVVEAALRTYVAGYESFIDGRKTRQNRLLLLGMALLTYGIIAAFHVRTLQLHEVRRAEIARTRFFALSLDLFCILRPDGRFDELNRSWNETTDHEREDLLGRPWQDFVHEDDRAAMDRMFAELLEGRPTGDVESRFRTADGTTCWLHWSATFDRESGRIYAIARDVTSRKSVEEVKNQFVSLVSHELRTPLTSIRGSLGLISGGVMGTISDKARGMLEIAITNSDRLIRLINDMLDLEKMESGKMIFRNRTLDLETIARHAIDTGTEFARSFDVGVVLEAEDGPFRVDGDPDRLQQVFANLISNAVKYSPKGGTVRVGLKGVGNLVTVRVKDEGEGIPKEFRDSVFEKFSQAESANTRKTTGTGLGLSITKAIIDRLGGTIGFDTKTGKGTTFWFQLPLVRETTRRPAPATPGPDAPSVGSASLLVCEDDHDMALLLRLILERDGHTVRVTHALREAREALSERIPAALILDLELPDGNGIDLVRELREDPKTRSLPVVIVSGNASEGRKELQGGALNVHDWIDKPVPEERLMEAVRSLRSRKKDATPRILHVEDDPDHQDLIHGILSPLGEIESASSVGEAERAIASGRYDLVLLDLNLPDGSGTSLISRLQASRPGVPVIIFSAMEEREELRAQVAEHLVKSRTSNETLLETVRRVLRDSDTRDRPRRKGAS